MGVSGRSELDPRHRLSDDQSKRNVSFGFQRQTAAAIWDQHAKQAVESPRLTEGSEHIDVVTEINSDCSTPSSRPASAIRTTLSKIPGVGSHSSHIARASASETPEPRFDPQPARATKRIAIVIFMGWFPFDPSITTRRLWDQIQSPSRDDRHVGGVSGCPKSLQGVCGGLIDTSRQRSARVAPWVVALRLAFVAISQIVAK